MRHIKNFTPFIMIIIVGLIYIFSVETSKAAIDTSRIIVTSLFPALFPFMLFSALLIEFGGANIIGYFVQFITIPLFNISGQSSTLLFLGTFSGYPYTALYGSELAKKHPQNKDELQRIVNTIFFPSYNYVVITLALALGEKKIAYLLLISLYISGFLALFILSAFSAKSNLVFKKWQEVKEENRIIYETIKPSRSLKKSIISSLIAFINMAGIILIFSTIIAMIKIILPAKNMMFLYPLIELTTGLSSLITANAGNILYLIPFYIGICGISILLQAYFFIADSPLSYKKFLVNRLFQAILNVLCFSILLGLFI